MDQYIFQTFISVFTNLYGEEFLPPLLNSLVNLESPRLYVEFMQYANTYDWDIYYAILELEIRGKYIYFYIIVSFKIVFFISLYT